jgi:hypothetical protein
MSSTYASGAIIATKCRFTKAGFIDKGDSMIRTITLTAIGMLALAACNPEPETIVGGQQPDPMAGDLANAAPVELPPAIASSKTYRCKDNSVVQIDWLAQDKGAYVHGDGQAQTHLKVAEAIEGKPASTDLVAEGGFVLKGNASASTVTLAMPGKGSQTCKA